MLAIGEHVFDEFSHQSHRDFEVRALQFLSEKFPDALAMSGEEGMLRAIRSGQQNAMLTGFETECTVICFLVLQFMFGSNVDVDPAQPEIRAALHDKTLAPDERMDVAMRLADERLEREHLAGSI